VVAQEHRLGKGVAAALGSAALMTCMAALVHVSGATLPSGQLLAARGFVAVLALLPVARRQGIGRVFRRDATALWARCAAGLGSIFCYFWTLQQVNVGGATALADTAPLFVLLSSALILRERPRAATVTASLLAVSGAVLVHQPWRSELSTRVALVGLLGAFFAGLAYASLRAAAGKFGRELVVWCLGWFMIAGGLATLSEWRTPQGSAGWAAILGVGLFGLLGQLALTTAYRDLPASLASTLGLSGLLFSVVFDVVLGGARPVALELAGYALVLLGGLGATLIVSRAPPSKPAPST
jgi:drug/metabolite transporter (DMT)-like permease